jgi:hypothetical protein
MKVENSQPRAQFRHLTKHFFGRFFDSEVFAGPGIDMHLLAVQILALLVIPGALRTFLSIYNYFMLAFFSDPMVHQAVLKDEYYFICVSMILTGFITVFEWDSLFPDEKDYYNLTPLPIGPRILFFAKLAALMLFIVFANAAINGVPILIFPWIVLTHGDTLGLGGTSLRAFGAMMYHVGNAASLLLSSLFVFTSFVAIRAALPLVCPVRLVRKVSRCIQLALILLLLYAIFSVIKAGHPVVEENGLTYSLPPFWFLGLFEMLTGHHALIYGRLAKTACIASAVSCILSILGYIISYRSSMQKGFQSSGIVRHPVSIMRKTCSWILHRTVLRGHMERAFYHFVAQTIFRRREHFLYCGSFAMVGVALVITIWGYISHDPQQHLHMLLSFPLILSFLFLVGLRYVFSVPADIDANWIFKITRKQRLKMSYKGVQAFMFCAANIPLLAVFVPYYIFVLDSRLVVMHVLFASALSLILIKLLLLRFEKLPFACTYIPGKANIKAFWLPYLLSFAMYSFETTALELRLLQNVYTYIAFVCIAVAVIIGLSIYRSAFLKGNNAIRFEEEPENAVNVLTIEG